MFTANQASWERAARITLGVVLLALGWSGIVTGAAALTMKVLGFIALLTGLAGWCPLYALFGFSTRGGAHRTHPV